MANWNNPNPINTNPSGDTVYQGFVKAENNFNDLYNKLNQVKKLQTGTTAPSNPAVGELWFDENAGVLKRYDGTNWVDIVAVPTLGNVADTTILEKIKNVDGAGSGLDADFLRGYPLGVQDYSQPVVWGYIPIVKTDGVMEVGKFIDFHLTSGSTADFEPRLEAIDPNNLVINGNKIWHAGNNPFYLNVNGYQRLSDSILIQWGQASGVVGTNQRINFPLTFPFGVYSVVVSESMSPPNGYIPRVVNIDTSGFTIYWDAFSSGIGVGTPVTFHYIAVGV